MSIFDTPAESAGNNLELDCQIQDLNLNEITNQRVSIEDKLRN